MAPVDRGVSPYLSPGARLGDYRIESFIDRGGMAFVYEATDLRLERHVALKVLAPDLSEDPEFQQRFLRESQFAARLDHPHIVPIYEAGDAGGLLYIAMRYVPGGDLSTLLRERGRLSSTATVSILSAVASALDAAHGAGLVHRDVKPGNILIASPDRTGLVEHVYLSDFGLTKRLSSKSRLTAAGTFAGTMSYVSPEQIQGRRVDARSDLYALGCVAYECLTGVAPFVREEQMALLWAHVTEDPAPPSSCDSALAAADAVLARAMAKDPDDRYPSGAEFVAALASALGQLAVTPAAGAAADPGAGPVLTETAPRTPVVVPQPSGVTPASGATAAAMPVQDPHFFGGARRAPVRRRAHNPRRTWLWPALAGLVVVALTAGWFLLGSRSTPEAVASPAVSLPFALETYGGGVEVSRTWSLASGGDRLHGELIVTGGAPGAAFDEVIPKSVTTAADRVTAKPAAQQVVRADPVLRFAAGGAADAQVTVAYDIPVHRGPATRARLKAWAADQKRERDAYFASVASPGPTTLASLTVRPDRLSVTPGQPHQLSLSGTNTDGSPAAPADLAKVLWSSSSDRVATVDRSGVVTGRAEGSVSVRADLGGLSAESVVLVADPGAPVTRQSYSLPDGRVVSPGPSGAPVVIAPVAPQICSTPGSGSGCAGGRPTPESPTSSVPNTTEPRPETCPTGSTRAADGTCPPTTPPVTPCEDGSTRPADGTCPPTTPPVTPCEDGSTRPADGTCPPTTPPVTPCENGSTRPADGTCPPTTPPVTPCENGFTRAPDGTCTPVLPPVDLPPAEPVDPGTDIPAPGGGDSSAPSDAGSSAAGGEDTSSSGPAPSDVPAPAATPTDGITS